MRSTVDETLRQILRGEDSFLELKEVVFAGGKIRGPRADAVADELVAFANGRGGVLILGVHDRTREIVGIPLERLDEVVMHVRNAAVTLVKPALDVVIERMELPDSSGEMRAVVRVEVDEGKAVYESPGGSFRRVGDAKRRLTSDEVIRLAQDRSNVGVPRFDGQIVRSASFSDLNPERIRQFRTVVTEDSDEILAIKLGMARRHGRGDIHPTVAGLLLAAKDAPPQQMQNAIIRAVAYRGRVVGDLDGGVNYQLDAHDIAGTLDAQVAEACLFVARNQKVAATKTIGRHDTPQYDLSAVFEAIVNAVAHRDYSLRGPAIRLRMFSDRMEINSPGGFPNAMTVEALEQRQSTRNEAVAILLGRCPVPEGIPGLTTIRTALMDRRGDGVGLIFRKSETLSGRKPKYELLDDSEVRLTIYAANPETGRD